MSLNVTAPIPPVPGLSAPQVTAHTIPAKIPAPGPSPVVPFAPVMRTKSPAGTTRVGPPDRAAMRQRRAQTGMTVSKLQRQLGLIPEDSDDPRAGWMNSLLTMSQQAWQALADALSFPLGPTGCAAMPAGAGKTVPLDDFRQRFSKDFEIWLSPSARQRTDMKGMIIVVGENHYEPAIQSLVKQVMMGYRRTRGDRFFIEGNQAVGCDERVRKYLMEPDDCRLMEQDSAQSLQLTKQNSEVLSMLKACVDYLRKHLPSAREPLSADNLQTYTEFIKQHAGKLPSSAEAGFYALFSVAQKAIGQLARDAKLHQPLRDSAMATMVRKEFSTSALNYVVVGAYHLHPMREHLRDLPCVFMLPKAMTEDADLPSLRETVRDEL